MPNNDLTKKDSFRELGLTGLDRSGGYVYDEFLSELRSGRKAKTYKQMRDNDPIIGAVLFAIDMLIRQVKWRVDPVSTDERDIQAADFLESCMNDMSHSWEDMISEILSMLVYGWSWHEIVYKRRLGRNEDSSKDSRFDDGKIGWRKISIRSQDTLYKWDFDEHGGIQAIIQQPPPNYNIIKIPIEKSLLFRTTSRKNNPEGRSILRNAYRPWYFKKNIEEIEGIGIERDLAGLPVAWVPPEILASDADADDKAVYNEIKDIIQNIRRDEQEGVIFPLVHDEDGNKIYDLELMSSGGKRQFDTNEIIKRYDQRIAMTVLADFILLGSNEHGSFALSSDKTDLFAVSLGAWLNSIAAVFNRHAIPRLFKLNGMDLENLPKIKPSDIEKQDLEQLADYVDSLAGAGATLFPNEELQNYLLEIADLPTISEGN